MIEALKSEDIVNKVGGRFKLCALIQKRLQQLVDGARPMVEREGRTDLELVIEEIMQDKIIIDWDRSNLPGDCPDHTRALLDDAKYAENAQAQQADEYDALQTA